MITTALATGGAVINGLGAVNFSTPEGDVDRILSLYGSGLEISEPTDGVRHCKMKLSSHTKLRDVLSAPDLPLGTVRVTSGNTFEFSHRGKKFSVSHQS